MAPQAVEYLHDFLQLMQVVYILSPIVLSPYCYLLSLLSLYSCPPASTVFVTLWKTYHRFRNRCVTSRVSSIAKTKNGTASWDLSGYEQFHYLVEQMLVHASRAFRRGVL